MQQDPTGKRYTLTLAAILLLLVALLFTTSGEREMLSLPESAMRETLAPLARVFFRVTGEISGAVRTIANLRHLVRENDRLYLEISRLMAENARLEEYRLENVRLRRLLDFQATLDYSTSAAQIVGRNPGNWLETVTINKGTRHGVKKDMAVATMEGLVGRVLSATPRTATVLLILDPRSAVGGMVQRTRTLVLVEGDPARPGLCSVKSLTQQSDLQVGDRVLSSGLGGIYPKGLVIGEIVEVVPGKYGVGKAAYLKPAVDFARLEEVVVITKASEPAGAPAEVGAQAPAEARQGAAGQ
ncbi:MAG: rod shape-determining protein MreC [Clostridia bacterium]